MAEAFRAVLCLSFVGTCILLVVFICERFTRLGIKRYVFFFYLLATLLFIFPLYPIKSGTEVNVTSPSEIVGLHIYDYLSNPYIIAVWLAVLFAYFIIWGIRNIRFHSKVKREARPVSEDVQHIFDMVCKEMGIRGTLSLVSSPLLHSPIGTGLFCRFVILPEKLVEEDEYDLELIFKHEIAHFRYHDHWLKLFANLVTIVHWFNPFVHILLKRLVLYCEMRCDSYAVDRLSLEERQYYCEMLINLAHGETRKNAYVLSTGFTRKRNMLNKRIESLASNDKKSRGKYASVLLCGMMISVAFLLSAFSFELTEDKIYQIYDTGGSFVETANTDQADNTALDESINVSKEDFTFTVDAKDTNIQRVYTAICSDSGYISFETEAILEESVEINVYLYTTIEFNEIGLQSKIDYRDETISFSGIPEGVYYYVGFEVKQIQQDIYVNITISD